MATRIKPTESTYPVRVQKRTKGSEEMGTVNKIKITQAS